MKAHWTGSENASRQQPKDVSLSTNLAARYWMQTLGVSRARLENAVEMVGTRVEAVIAYLNQPETRLPIE